MRQRLAGIGVGGIGAADVNIGHQADVRAGGTDTNLIPAALDLPAVSSGVPVAERLVIERERNRAALPCRKRHPCKGLQLLRRAEDLRTGLCDIDLHDLRAVTRTGVGHGQAHTVGSDLQVGIGKACVAQTVAERERHRHPGGLVIAVADIESLAVLHGAACPGKVILDGGFLIGIGPCLGQLTAGVDLAGQHIHHGTGTGLPPSAP